jgi:hypothetical protein
MTSKENPRTGLVKTNPWFKFYPDAMLGDVDLRACSPRAQAVWFYCLCVMHTREPYGHLAKDGRAMTVAEVSKATSHSPTVVEKALAELEARGVCSKTADGVLYSRKMVYDRAVAERKASASADKRRETEGSPPSRGASSPPSLAADGPTEAPHQVPHDAPPQRLETRNQNTTTTKKRESKEVDDPRVDEIVAHYVSLHPQRRPGGNEQRAIRKALDEFGYSVDDLKKAISGNARSTWHIEQRQVGLSLILRDNEHIDRFKDIPEPVPLYDISKHGPVEQDGAPSDRLLWLTDPAHPERMARRA